MIYLLFAFVLFCLSVMTHIFYCRRTPKPGLHAKAFIFTAGIFLAIYAASIFSLQDAQIFRSSAFWGLPFRLTAAAIFILLVPVYLCFYVLTQLSSPSKIILLAIVRRGSLSLDEIVKCVKKEDFINSRLNDLEKCGCVKLSEGRYVLSPSGWKIAGILELMQRILGRGTGG